MIDIQDVTFSYGESEVNSLENINLTINDGEFVVLLGPSGCGKTSVTRLINGLVPEFYQGNLRGNILVENHNTKEVYVSQLSDYVGSVFQDPHSQFFTTDTTSEIVFACENEGMPREEIQKNLKNIVEKLEIEKLLDRSVLQISGGEKQMVAIASICAYSPKILVLDEPSANLDGNAVEQLKKILEKLKNEGYTIVVSEHRIHYLKELCDRAILINNGKIENELSGGEFRKLSNDEAHSFGLRAIDLKSLDVGAKLEPEQDGKYELSLDLEIDIQNNGKCNPSFDSGTNIPNNTKCNSSFDSEINIKSDYEFDIEAESKVENKAESRAESTVENNKRGFSLNELTYYYKKNNSIINNLSCDFNQGEVIGVIGKNGIGKTTLLETICGLRKEKKGSISFNGEKKNLNKRSKESYLVMQTADYQLFTDSVEKEICMGFKGNDEKSKCEELIKKMKLDGLNERHPASLSGGQKQRLCVAVAYMKNANIICFDEPTSGLDYFGMLGVTGILRELASSGKTVFVVTHDYEFLLNSCNKVMYMSNENAAEIFGVSNDTKNKIHNILLGKEPV